MNMKKVNRPRRPVGIIRSFALIFNIIESQKSFKLGEAEVAVLNQIYIWKKIPMATV